MNPTTRLDRVPGLAVPPDGDAALLPVGDWPGVSLSCVVETGGMLAVTLDPSGDAAGADLYARAVHHLANDTVATIETPLAAHPYDVDVDALWRYAVAGYLAAAAATSAGRVVATATVADLCDGWGVTPAALAAANAAGDARALLGETLPVVPAYAEFTEGGSADDLAGGVRPGGGAEVLALDDNATVPLRAGAVLATPPRPLRIADPDASLAAVAAAARTLPGSLATDNATVPGLLRPGAVLAYDGATVTVPAGGWSFAQAAAAFAGAPDVAALAAANADVTGLLATAVNAALTTRRFVVADGETLAANASGVSSADLAAANGATPDLFAAGTVLRTGAFADVAVTPDRTLDDVAADHGCPPAALLAANPGLTLHDAAIPGRVAVPDTALVPYSVRDGDALDAVAARFATGALALAALNADVPGTLAPDRDVTAGAATTTTVAGDSFAAVHGRLGDEVTFAEVVAATGGCLATGALLVCPAAAGPAGGTPRAAAAAFGIDPVAFAGANTTTDGLVAPGVALTYGGTTATTAAHDTIGSLAALLGATVAEVVAANADVAFLVAGARALLPPAPLTLRLRLPETLPADATFPLRLAATLRLARNGETADTTVPCRQTRDGATRAAFAAAYPDLRLATGAGREVWAVSFGEGGVTGVSFATPPRTYALRPLYLGSPGRFEVAVHPVQPDGTLAREAITTVFGEVDTDVWAATFLDGVDTFLAAPYSAALDAEKRQLAGAIARGLWPVLDGTAAGPALDAAVARLTEELVAGLAAGHAVTAVVQYDATVTPPARTVGGLPTRLLGTGIPPEGAAYTASAARTDLTAATSYVTFLLRASEPDRATSLRVGLRYDVTGLEYDAPSRRLVFDPPLTGDAKPAALKTELPAADVPVVLRGYPGLPRLTGQRAVAPEEPATLAAAAAWTYGIAYTHELGRDEVEVTARFNPVPRMTAAGPDDLASALARYVTAAPDLWPLLEGVASGTGDPAVGANAAASYAGLVGAVAQAWDRHWTEPAPAAKAPPHGENYTVRIRLRTTTNTAGETWYDVAEVTAVTATAGPDGAWPDIAYVTDDGATALTPGDEAGGVRLYAFPPGLHAVRWATIDVSWPGLPAVAYQSASSSARVRRNARLLGPGGPAVDPRFVYTGPEVAAPGTVVPALTVPETDITELGTVAEGLAAALADLAGTVGEGSVATAYEYEIAPGMTTSLPVSMTGVVPLGAAVAADVAAVAQRWLDEMVPPRTDGSAFVFGVTLDPPVVVAARLVHRLAP